MALYEIPCAPNGASHWTQRTQLDGAEYILTFDWSQRDGHWSLSIADTDENPLHTGIVLVAGMGLLAHELTVGSNLREIYVLDRTQAGDADPGFGDLGARFALVYISVS